MVNALKRHDAILKTERVACGFCDSHDAKRLYTEQYALGSSVVELGINRCRECRLVYVSPRLTPEATRLVYKLDAAQTISSNYCWDGSASERRFGPLLKRLSKLARPGTLIDVGCGGGQFLRAAKRAGRWKVSGIEPIAEAAQQAQQYSDSEVRCSTLDAANFASTRFDVVSMLGVLEHLHDPIATLRLTRKLLKPDGVLAAYVPNYNYLALKDTGPVSYARTRRWSKLHPQEHLFHFTPASLRRILEACGFDVLRIDVGRPFTPRHVLKRLAKEAAYWATCAMYASTGIHFGGLEVIARVNSKVSQDAQSSVARVAA